MNQEAGKTRAELLEELTGPHDAAGSHDQPFDREAVKAFFLYSAGKGGERLTVEERRRIEREYLLLAGGKMGPCKGKNRSPGEADGAPRTDESLCASLANDAFVPHPDAAGNEGDPDALCQAVADEAVELMEAECALVAVADGTGKRFSYRGVAGAAAQSLLGETRPVDSESVCGWVIRQGTPYTAADVRTDLRGAPEFRDLPRMRSAAAAPLVADGRVAGVIAVAGSKRGVPFSGEQIRERLLPLARHTASLIAQPHSSPSEVTA